MKLQSYVGGVWRSGGRTPGLPLRDASPARCSPRHRPPGSILAPSSHMRVRLGGPALRAHDISRAGRRAQGACQAAARFQGRVLRAVVLHGCDKSGFLDRYRRRHRHDLRVREQGCTRTAEQSRVSRWRRRGSVERRQLPGSAHLCAAGRRGGAYQRVQFPGVGNAGETCARDTRRHAGHRQAGDGDGVSRGARRTPDHRVGHFARGRTAARVRQLGQSVRPFDVSGFRFPLQAPRTRPRGCVCTRGSFGTRYRSLRKPIR